MWTYILRWQVINCLYQLQQKRGHVWIEEHDLCAFIGGVDISTHTGPDTWVDKMRSRLSCLLFGVVSHEELYQKIRNVIHECKEEEVHWIRATKGTDNISEYLNLTTRGREIYGYVHWLTLFLDNYYVRWAVPVLVVYLLAHYFNISIQPK